MRISKELFQALQPQVFKYIKVVNQITRAVLELFAPDFLESLMTLR